jgi:6-phosphogluconate dehydrogenase
MGANMVARLQRAGIACVVTDRSADAIAATTAATGATGAPNYAELVRQLAAPRAVWVMVPAGVVGAVIDELSALLSPGDVIIDGGNSRFEHDLMHAAALRERGIGFIDVGTSGGVFGLERGYCLMIGGHAEHVARLSPVFQALAPGRGDIPPTRGRAEGRGSAEEGWLHCGEVGAGHFVKMVHNAIEYGMMAAYAEGFNILAHANLGDAERAVNAETTPLERPERYRYQFDLPEIAELWRRGSVIPSWLLDLCANALHHNPQLTGFSGRVSDSGEGRWTLSAANDLAVPVPVIASSIFSRFASRGEDDFANRLLSALRKEFGGHHEVKS